MDLLKKLMAVDPKNRPSAKKALEHPFLQTKSEAQIDISNKSLIKVSSGTLSGTNTPLDLSKESLGSLSLVTRKPLLNGRIETIEKLSQNCLNSAGNIDVAGCLTPKKQTSKFSNIKEQHTDGKDGKPGEESPVYSNKKKAPQFFQSDLHKKAIINNLNRKEFEEEKKN